MKNVFFALHGLLSRKNHPKTAEAARHAKKNWKKHRPAFSVSNALLVLTLLFLFAPLIFIIIFSFNGTKGSEFTNFSLVWYKKLLFNSDKLWASLLNSVIIAFSAGIVSTILGTLASIGINWYKFRGRNVIQTLTYLPMVLPEVIVGIHVPLGLFTIFAAHTTFCLPFVFLMVNARLDEFDYSIIEAAHDLGASELQTMLKVVVPAIMPGILSGFMMAITMSLEDFVITYFVGGPGSTTLPVYVYSSIKYGVSPVINSLSCVMISITCLLAFTLRKGLKGVAASH